MESDFEDDWRKVVERKVSIYGSLSVCTHLAISVLVCFM